MVRCVSEGILISVLVCTASAQSYTISTVVGAVGLPNNVPGKSVTLGSDIPQFLTSDAAGNVYFSGANSVLRLDGVSGLITTIAGGVTSGYRGDNGPAVSALLDSPQGLAIDSSGNLFIADSGNAVIRKISGGIITTIAGNAVNGHSCASGPAASTKLDYPEGLALDAAGNLYIADYYCVVKLSQGNLTIVAGTGTRGYTGDGSLAVSATMTFPKCIAVDSAGNLYIADSGNYVVRKVTASTGVISTVAGSGQCCTVGGYVYAGSATQVEFVSPFGLAVDAGGNLYISDSSVNVITKVTNSTISLVAGAANINGFSGDGGSPIGAEMNYVGAIALDAAGNLYLADQYNERIRKISGGVINTIAGIGNGDGGPATAAQLASPGFIAVDAAGNIYIPDLPVVRKVTASTGIITTIAGNGMSGPTDTLSLATQTELVGPYGVAVDSSGNVYIADHFQKVILEVQPGGRISAIAGNGQFGATAGPALTSELLGPVAISLDPSGDLYFTDNSDIICVPGNCYSGYTWDPAQDRVNEVSHGLLSVVAGNGSRGYTGDGGPANASALNYPRGIAIDSTGNIYLADTANHRIRKVSAQTGDISTVAGTGTKGSLGDGQLAILAEVTPDGGIAIDKAGNIYISDGGSRIRKISAATGTITTIAGSSVEGYSGDNGPATSALLTGPGGLAVDAAGDIYFVDGTNIRVLKPTVASSGPAITLVANAEGEAPMIAPNTWVEVKGSDLAPAGDSRPWQASDFVNNQLPTSLDGVSVTVNGAPAYVYYISPTQINVLTPPGALSGSVQVVVTNGTPSPAFSVPAQAASPSFFVFNGGPYVAATHVNGSLIGPTTLYPGLSTPAAAGETIVIYGNGFGATSTAVTAGAASQSGTLSPLPAITIGGMTARVQFAGLNVTPGEFQFNVVVPSTLAAGDQPIVATYNGLTTQTGTLVTVQ